MNETKITTLQGFERKRIKHENINQMFEEAVEFVRETVRKRIEEQERIKYSDTIEDLVA